MHLAVLMTNTDESAFSRRHPKDGEKFADLIHRVRPDWQLTVYPVKDGVFPEDLTGYDGVIITGSPASVNSGADWVARLLDLIRQTANDGLAMFGACFGHQAIAKALGGRVGANPCGLAHGLSHNTVTHRPGWAKDLPADLRLYASHKEHVTALPDGARVICASDTSPVTGFAIGTRIYTTQHHPEMSREFIAALTEEMAPEMTPQNLAQARASLTEPADSDIFAETVARFFEQAPPP